MLNHILKSGLGFTKRGTVLMKDLLTEIINESEISPANVSLETSSIEPNRVKIVLFGKFNGTSMHITFHGPGFVEKLKKFGFLDKDN